MHSENKQLVKRARRGSVRPAGAAPSCSRIRLGQLEEPLSFRKQTDSYFKIINEEWVPEVIGDWDLPYRIYQAGDSKGWLLRPHPSFNQLIF